MISFLANRQSFPKHISYCNIRDSLSFFIPCSTQGGHTIRRDCHKECRLCPFLRDLSIVSQFIVFLVTDAFAPLSLAFLAWHLDGEVPKPRIRRRAVPMLDALGDIHHIAGL